MISKRLLQVALVALSASQVAHAHYGPAVGGIVAREEEGLIKRQTTNPGSSAPANTARPSSATTNAPSPSPPVTTTTNRPPTTATTRPPTTNTPVTETSSPKPDPTTETSSSKSEDKPETKTSEEAKTTSTLPPTTSTIIQTVTNTDGSVSTKTSESVTTPVAIVPSQPNQDGSNTGMSTTTRNTIIGVVVGVGGAIIIAVIGLFVYRMVARKKAASENDGLMDYGTPGYHPGPAEPKDPSVPGSSSVGTAHGRSPFQSTLESYHAPTQVNTASNF